jgi:hypothetical protein
MRSKLLNVDPPVTYAVVLDTGDEAMGKLAEFIRKNEVEAAPLTAIGAFRRAFHSDPADELPAPSAGIRSPGLR